MPVREEAIVVCQRMHAWGSPTGEAGELAAKAREIDEAVDDLKVVSPPKKLDIDHQRPRI
ncbi:MAG: hypothetical protein WCN99_05620 [bacterium]